MTTKIQYLQLDPWKYIFQIGAKMFQHSILVTDEETETV